MFGFDTFDPDGLSLLVAAGTRDPYCPLADLDRLAARLPDGAIARIEGADHFFFGKLFPLGGGGAALGARVGHRLISGTRGSRAGVAVPAERMMRIPSSTVSPVARTSSRGSTITSPR